MANAKKCDICGKFYPVPEFIHGIIPDSYYQQLDYIRIHRADENEASMHFDSCKECLQDVLDHILSKAATNTELAK